LSASKKYRTIGIDLDRADNQTEESFVRFVRNAERRARIHGTLTASTPTARGHHLKLTLPRKVGFWRTIELRYFIGDDPRRMFYDIMRHRNGGYMVDTLFDFKAEFVPIRETGTGRFEYGL